MPDGVVQRLDATSASFPVAVVVAGDVEDDDVAYARQKIIDLCEQIADPILDARVKVTSSADPARERPAIAKASLDVNGNIIRAHVSAHTVREAADLLQARLRDKLEQRAKHHQALWSAPEQAQPGEWTHTALPTARPEFFDRPIDERQLVRHKTFSVAELTPDEAAFDMEQLDYDFHLFCDLASGQDSLIERLPGGTYRLTRLEPSPVGTGPTQIQLDVSTTAAPTLTADQAIEHLDTTGDPFVFFADATTGRGNIVYRRYDGHYGLIAPAT